MAHDLQVVERGHLPSQVVGSDTLDLRIPGVWTYFSENQFLGVLPSAEVYAILPAADHMQSQRLRVKLFGLSQVGDQYISVPQLHWLDHESNSRNLKVGTTRMSNAPSSRPRTHFQQTVGRTPVQPAIKRQAGQHSRG